MKKRILVTGGLGYIGGYLSHYLHNQNHYEVLIGTRNTNRSLPPQLPGANLVLTDWDNIESLAKATKEVDVVIHLAAMNEVDAAKDPKMAMKQTAQTTKDLLQVSINNKVKTFLNISTARVYKNPFTGIIDENSDVNPDHPYSIAHREAEIYVEKANDNGELRGTNIRLSNCFGAPLTPDINRWTLVMNDLCKKVVSTRKLVLLSPGLQRRDFITLKDASRAIEHIMNLTGVYAKETVFNVGSGWTPSILEIAQIIAQRCTSHLNFTPQLIVPPPSENDHSNELLYNNKKLLSTGFKLDNDYIKEIDSLLDFCFMNFSKSSVQDV